MFSRKSITKSTGTYSNNVKFLKQAFANADAVVIGAGAGLSTSAGFVYNGERFEKYFSDFASKYRFTDMYSGGFYLYSTHRAIMDCSSVASRAIIRPMRTRI